MKTINNCTLSVLLILLLACGCSKISTKPLLSPSLEIKRSGTVITARGQWQPDADTLQRYNARLHEAGIHKPQANNTFNENSIITLFITPINIFESEIRVTPMNNGENHTSIIQFSYETFSGSDKIITKPWGAIGKQLMYNPTTQEITKIECEADGSTSKYYLRGN